MDRDHTTLWDDDTLEDPACATALSRRHLLGAVAGGLVLAGSGLLLPAWLGEEAEAAEHPVHRAQQRKDHQREQRRRWRAHRREQKRHHTGNNEDHAPRGGSLFDVSCFVYNDTPVTTPNGSAEIKYWYGDDNDDWQLQSTTQIANGTWGGKFGPHSDTVGIIIDSHVYIKIENLPWWWPQVSIKDGATWLYPGSGGALARDVLREKGLNEQEQVEATGQRYHFTIKRLYDVKHDGGGEKVFDIHFRPK